MPVKNDIRTRIAAVAAAIVMTVPVLSAGELVILQTNDTHSQLDPTDKNLGGIQRRKVVVDSIRAVNPDLLLIDAGDAVQGTLFFTLYGGEAEMKMMNALGYDYAILGNHDFDNGVAPLVENLKHSDAKWISTNYDLSGSPLQPYFSPYAIREVDGKKIGIIGINLDPKGMISEGNYDGVVYLDGIKAANATAWHLKHNEKVDMVIAVTHIGYDDVPLPSDKELASKSEDIDIILGGHSHTVIKPGSGDEWVTNAAGRKVLVTQNGKSGLLISQVTVDLDSIGQKLPEYKQIAIDSRLDGRIDHSLDSILSPYRKGVDEMMALKIGESAMELGSDGAPLLNFLSDFVLERGKELAGKNVDLALLNKGSIRRGLPKGAITQGQIITMQPFDNRILVEEIKGSDLAAAFDVMALRGGDGVSRGVEAVFDPATHKCVSIVINGKPLDPDATYRVATIDYLANGGDYMEPLKRGTVIARSPAIVYNDLIDHIRKNYRKRKINPPAAVRMRQQD
ncbi:MAG: bifunctional metallophosphatase/5'-nucleotidase [Muribaculaceae bacterium]|nr:bifunctional metallophosphatase/5'-nucleotidase [Muribaculaceae bacterium]